MADPKPLTETHIAAMRRESRTTGKRLELPDVGKGALPGLSLVCNPSGVTVWVLRRRLPAGGNPLRFPIGAYTDLSLARARDAGMVMRTKIDAGQDPTVTKPHVESDPKAETFETLDKVIALYEKSPDVTRSWANAKRTVRIVFKPLLETLVTILQPKDFKLCANAYHAQPSAKLALRTLRPILLWGEELGHVPEGLSLFRIRGKALKRKRFLDDAELSRVLPVLYGMQRSHSNAMLLMLWAGARREEAAKATWDEFDLDEGIWTLPEIYTDPDTKQVIVRTKNESEHVVYLPHQAVSMLRSINPDSKTTGLVFPARQRGGKQSPVGGWDRFTKLVFTKSQTSDWTRHDLRRTAATIMGNLGTEPHVIEAALNHIVIYTNLAGTYNQARYRSEVGIALQALADRLDAIAAGTAKPLTGRRQKELVEA